MNDFFTNGYFMQCHHAMVLLTKDAKDRFVNFKYNLIEVVWIFNQYPTSKILMKKIQKKIVFLFDLYFNFHWYYWSHDYFAYAQNLHFSCLRLPRFWRIYNQFLYRHIFITNENLCFVKCEQMDLKWTFMNLNRNKMVRLIYKSLFLESISPSNTLTMIGAAWSFRYRFPHVLGHSVETWFISYHYKCHLHSWKECIRRGGQMS